MIKNKTLPIFTWMNCVTISFCLIVGCSGSEKTAAPLPNQQKEETLEGAHRFTGNSEIQITGAGGTATDSINLNESVDMTLTVKDPSGKIVDPDLPVAFSTESSGMEGSILLSSVTKKSDGVYIAKLTGLYGGTSSETPLKISVTIGGQALTKPAPKLRVNSTPAVLDSLKSARTAYFTANQIQPDRYSQTTLIGGTRRPSEFNLNATRNKENANAPTAPVIHNYHHPHEKITVPLFISFPRQSIMQLPVRILQELGTHKNIDHLDLFLVVQRAWEGATYPIPTPASVVTVADIAARKPIFELDAGKPLTDDEVKSEIEKIDAAERGPASLKPEYWAFLGMPALKTITGTPFSEKVKMAIYESEKNIQDQVRENVLNDFDIIVHDGLVSPDTGHLKITAADLNSSFYSLVYFEKENRAVVTLHSLVNSGVYNFLVITLQNPANLNLPTLLGALGATGSPFHNAPVLNRVSHLIQ